MFFCFQIVSGVAFGRYLDLVFGVLYSIFELLLPSLPSTVCGVSDTIQRVSPFSRFPLASLGHLAPTSPLPPHELLFAKALYRSHPY